MPHYVAMTGSIAALFIAAFLFVVSHLVLAHDPARGAIVAKVGESRFLLVYSAVSILLFVWALAAYGAAPYVELWWPGTGLRLVPLVLMPFAFILLVCGYFGRNPTAVQERFTGDEAPAAGIVKVTRHPVMWAIVLWAIGHIAANGDLASFLFMGAMLVLALAGMVMIDRKTRARTPEAWARLAPTTSTLPFAALIQGRTTMSISEIGWWKVGVGLVLYLLFLAVHPWLFGVSALPL